MRLTICAVGRMRRGPEHDLVAKYLDRFGKTGRQSGIGPVSVIEVDDRKGAGARGEAALLERASPKGAFRLALDERGRALSSPELAELLAQRRDAGCPDMTFSIGGADGLDPDFRDGCDGLISFGPMVWPHMLARVMLAEQLYRAASILAGTPYHRN